jgi:hypothetical protein
VINFGYKNLKNGWKNQNEKVFKEKLIEIHGNVWLIIGIIHEMKKLVLWKKCLRLIEQLELMQDFSLKMILGKILIVGID